MMNSLKRPNVSQPYKFSAVVVAISKASNRGHTSAVYARRLNKDHRGEGDPFRLRHSWISSRNEARYIWSNQMLRTLKIELGTIVTVIEHGLDNIVFAESLRFKSQVREAVLKRILPFKTS